MCNIDSQYMSRKTLKTSIMTKPYSASYKTVYNSYCEAVMDLYKYDIRSDPEEVSKFKKFYDYLEEDMETDLFLDIPSKYIKTITSNEIEIKKNIQIDCSGSSVDFIYYKFRTKSMDFIVKFSKDEHITPDNVKRITKKYLELTDEIDIQKVLTSIRANYIHFLDAVHLRNVIKDCDTSLMTIHDCFLVDFLNVGNFLELYNTKMNINIDHFHIKRENFQSIFIII